MITDHDISLLPQAPGVYYFRDSRGDILYIGKAKRIRDRVHQHVVANYEGLKADFMARSAHVTYRVTETPMEAAIREGEEIKKYQPPYNVLWKDDKNFFFIGVTHELGPQIFITHQPQTKIRSTKSEIRNKFQIRNPQTKTHPATFFGPFVEKQPVAEIMRALRILFGMNRGTLVRRAKGWRVQGVTWQETVRDIRIFFRKGLRTLLHTTETAMQEASARHDFERAGYFRDKAARLERFLHAQKVATMVAQENDMTGALHKVQIILKLDRLPRHIEGYDISHIQGTAATASLVVARDGIMTHGDYKQFKIKTIRGANDVAMLRETLTRRCKHAEADARLFWPLPDLFLIDGGKSQVRAVVDVLTQFNIKIPVVGLAKRDERLVMMCDGQWYESKYERDNVGLQLLQRVRDEAHRFARAYHHRLRARAVGRN